MPQKVFGVKVIWSIVVLYCFQICQSLESGCLFHYFIANNNIFQHLDKTALRRAAQRVDLIIHDPIGTTGNIMKGILRYYSD